MKASSLHGNSWISHYCHYYNNYHSGLQLNPSTNSQRCNIKLRTGSYDEMLLSSLLMRPVTCGPLQDQADKTEGLHGASSHTIRWQLKLLHITHFVTRVWGIPDAVCVRVCVCVCERESD